MNRKIIAIDYMSLLYKAFYGVRPMHSSDGTPTNAVYGFLNMFLKLLNDHQPDCIFVASDESRHTFRTDIYSDYKGGRDAMPEDMRQQVPLLIDILRSAGVKFISAEGYEADDIIGFIATQAEKNSDRLTIVTGDRDSFQLASDSVSILYAKRGVSDTVDVTPGYIMEEYGLAPKQLIELKALMGDKSDNIPGVAGVGEKTALDLIRTYSSVDGVYENIDNIKGKLRDKLIADRDNAYMSRRLGEILRDLPVELDYDTADDFDMKRPEVIDILSKYELKSIIRNLGAEEEKKEEKPAELTFREEEPDLSSLKGKTCAVYMSDPQTGTDTALCCGGEIYVMKEASAVFLKELFSARSGTEIIVHDAKSLWKALKNRGIEADNIVFDTFVAAYVINSSDERYELPFIAKKYLGETIPEGPSGQKSFFDLAGEEASLMAQKVSCIAGLYPVLKDKLSSDGEEALYYDIEHRLIFVLAEMEMLGFRVDREGLLEIGRDLNARIEALTEKILETAGKGRDFNINSTKQLGALLFDELKLPVIKKTKTGYSTDSEVL
ncbi:MAG: DNA polymerase I, partial [Eubacteriaceae bacterium]|nr:DNA polymerase I [Eubacteriaceae bacterium]